MRWIVGDIHGMLLPLRTVLDAVRHRDPNPRFYFVGDYCNRGPDTNGVIELLIGLPNAQFVRGNHDDVCDLILNGTSAVHGDAKRAYHWFIDQGLDMTLASYGVDLIQALVLAEHPTLAGIQQMCRVVPTSHRQFLQGLPLVIDEDDFFVAHAWYSVDTPDTPPLSATVAFDPLARRRMVWNRYSTEEIRRPKEWTRTGYFGHTPVFNYSTESSDDQALPIRGPHIVLLDTAAAVDPRGRLTAFCHETKWIVQSDRLGRLVLPRSEGETTPDPARGPVATE